MLVETTLVRTRAIELVSKGFIELLISPASAEACEACDACEASNCAAAEGVAEPAAGNPCPLNYSGNYEWDFSADYSLNLNRKWADRQSAGMLNRCRRGEVGGIDALHYK